MKKEWKNETACDLCWAHIQVIPQHKPHTLSIFLFSFQLDLATTLLRNSVRMLSVHGWIELCQKLYASCLCVRVLRRTKRPQIWPRWLFVYLLVCALFVRSFFLSSCDCLWCCCLRVRIKTKTNEIENGNEMNKWIFTKMKMLSQWWLVTIYRIFSYVLKLKVKKNVGCCCHCRCSFCFCFCVCIRSVRWKNPHSKKENR